MIREEFSVNRIPFMLSDHERLMVNIEAGGIIDIRTDDPGEAQLIKDEAVMSIKDHIMSYSGTAALDELADTGAKIEAEVSEEIKARSGKECIVVFEYFLPDENSQEMIDNVEKMQRMSDPAVAAAELEKALKKAQETAAKNGISMQDIQNMSMPDLPPLPDGSDPLALANALLERNKTLRQMAVSAPAAGCEPKPENVQPSPRPKFCANCGSRLPESGNFCPNCGAKCC